MNLMLSNYLITSQTFTNFEFKKKKHEKFNASLLRQVQKDM
jgi:hypothetical protein